MLSIGQDFINIVREAERQRRLELFVFQLEEVQLMALEKESVDSPNLAEHLKEVRKNIAICQIRLAVIVEHGKTVERDYKDLTKAGK